MKKYRISKYNPLFRDEQGRYLVDEWTSFSDIGNSYDGKVFSLDEYECVENKYIQVLKAILQDKSIDKLIVKDLEKNFTLKEIDDLLNCGNLYLSENEKILLQLIVDESEISIIDVKELFKILLREYIWCRLISTMNNLVIEFGYDFYMYIYCNNISQHILDEIRMLQLYIEEMPQIENK